MNTNTTATTPEPVVGEFAHLDPHSLDIEVNIRTEAALTAEFVATIAAEGVLIPVRAVRRADGTVLVRDGQRRTLAARAAGAATIPVYITAENAADERARDLERTRHQYISNEHRAALTGRERAEAMAHMLDLGLTPAKVAKALHVDRTQVAAAAVTVTSETATTAYDSGSLTLEQSSVLVEFDADPNAVDRLLEAAGRGRFDHVAAQLRDEADTRARWSAAAVDYTDQGYRVIEARPGWNDGDANPLSRLLTADGEHAEPGHIIDKTLLAVYLEETEQFVDADSGEEIDEGTVDWATDEDPDLEPGEGLRHARTVEVRAGWTPAWYCTDPAAAGLHDRYHRDTTSGDTRSDDAESAAKAKERESEARRQVLRLNKLGAAAQTVRRAWVTELLARKTPPKQAAAFVAAALAADLHLLTQNQTRETATELLGLTGASLLVAIEKATPARAQVITLALVVGAYEARTTKDAWRHAYGARDVEKYLHLLQSLGYTLSQVEEVAAGDRTAEQVSSTD